MRAREGVRGNAVREAACTTVCLSTGGGGPVTIGRARERRGGTGKETFSLSLPRPPDACAVEMAETVSWWSRLSSVIICTSAGNKIGSC